MRVLTLKMACFGVKPTNPVNKEMREGHGVPEKRNPEYITVLANLIVALASVVVFIDC